MRFQAQYLFSWIGFQLGHFRTALKITLLLVLLNVLATMLGCKFPTTPVYGEKYTPPPTYETYWTEIQTCSGLQGDYSKLEWYRIEDGALGTGVIGRWDYPHRITLTEFVISREIVVTIQHEMLHDLTQSGKHSAIFIVCGVNP